MKKLFSILFSLFIINSANAQGFSKIYTLGYRYLEFYKAILEHDTLVMNGYLITKDSIPKYGVFLSKFDTLGHLISFTSYIEKPNEEIAYYPDSKLLKTKDGGYLTTLSLFDNAEGLIKFKYDGTIEKVRYYSDKQPKINKINFVDILELKDGYFVEAAIDAPLTRDSVRFIKFDKNLDKMLWQKNYCEDKLCYYSSPFSCSEKGKNISIFIFKSDLCQGIDLSKSKGNIFELIIDSLGNKISDTYVKALDKFYINGVFLDSNNNKVVFGEKVVGYVNDRPYLRHNIIKLDSLNKSIWNTVYSEKVPVSFTEQYHGFQTKDKHYITVGTSQTITQYKSKDINNHVGSIYKFGEDGNLEWKRTDTIYNQLYKSPNYLNGIFLSPIRGFYGAVELPNGSIIACGFSDRYTLDEVKDSIIDFHSEAWLYKVDKNGCLNSKDCATVSINDTPSDEKKSSLNVFPNPTQSQVSIKIDNNSIKNIDLYDINAKRLQAHLYETPLSEVTLTLPENTNNHLFLLKIKLNDGSIVMRKVIKN
jgi:hypothetical protein